MTGHLPLNYRHLVFFVVISASLYACATHDFERQSQSTELTVRERKNSQEIKLWLENRYGKFFEDSVIILREISLLRKHPGWPDMERIITVLPSIEYVEGENSAYLKRTSMITEWSNKWRTSGENVHNTYIELVKRSSSMETRKQLLLEEWNRLSSERSVLTITRYTQSSSTFPKVIIEANQKQDATIRDDLNSFGLDAIGLYQIKPRSALADRLNK
jgi:hypothetical protein